MSTPKGKYNDNRFRKILLDHLKELDANITLKDVAHYLHIEEKTLQTNFPSSASKEIQQPFPLRLIRQLYLGFGIPYKKFLLNESEISAYIKSLNKSSPKGLYTSVDQIFSPWRQKHDPVLDFLHIDYRSTMPPEAKEKLRENYSPLVMKYITKADRSLKIYEYLGKGGSNNNGVAHLKPYGECHEEIFQAIEEKIKTGTLYSRFLALPYSYKKEKGKSLKDFAIEAIQICSLPLFRHICRCLMNENFKDRAKFYVTSSPRRPYHFGLIESNKDEGKYVLSEYYRYSNSAGLMPDILFIEKVDAPHTTTLFDLYNSELEYVSDDENVFCFNSIEQLKALTEETNGLLKNPDRRIFNQIMNQKIKELYNYLK